MYFQIRFVLTTLFLNELAFGQGNVKVRPSAHSFLSRIVGGYKTNISAIGGYLVALREDGDFICGGSYVAERFVVTAAHCISHSSDNIEGLTIEGGVSSLTETSNPVGIESAAIPRDYNNETQHMDVAVLKLKEPLQGKNIGKIPFCNISYKAGDKMVVSGWGYNKHRGIIMNNVRSVAVPILDKKKCKKTYSDVSSLTDSMLCAGLLGKKDSCTYDSGGPLVYQSQLCGIVSFGVGCADKKYPGVYTDVKYVLPFIKFAIANL